MKARENTIKKCSRCKEFHCGEEFYTGRDGNLSSQCRSCHRHYMRDAYWRDPIKREEKVLYQRIYARIKRRCK